MANLTGEQLFFRYAWPCAEIRLSRKEITEEQFGLLKFFRDNQHRNPGRKLLIACFPVAVKDLTEVAHRMFASDPWSLEHVAEYWRHHHVGPSPTEMTTVESQGIDRMWVRTKDWRLIPVLNPYSIDAEAGNTIVVHNHHAIEKI